MLPDKYFLATLNDSTIWKFSLLDWMSSSLWNKSRGILITPIDKVELNAYTSMNLAAFIPLVVLGITAAAIAFGEIRLLTGSVWPAVLMHAMSNLFTTTLITAGVFRINRPLAFFFTTGIKDILSIILIAFFGLGCIENGREVQHRIEKEANVHYREIRI